MTNRPVASPGRNTWFSMGCDRGTVGLEWGMITVLPKLRSLVPVSGLFQTPRTAASEAP